jgi:hypothetical protein
MARLCPNTCEEYQLYEIDTRDLSITETQVTFTLYVAYICSEKSGAEDGAGGVFDMGEPHLELMTVTSTTPSGCPDDGYLRVCTHRGTGSAGNPGPEVDHIDNADREYVAERFADQWSALGMEHLECPTGCKRIKWKPPLGRDPEASETEKAAAEDGIARYCLTRRWQCDELPKSTYPTDDPDEERSSLPDPSRRAEFEWLPRRGWMPRRDWLHGPSASVGASADAPDAHFDRALNSTPMRERHAGEQSLADSGPQTPAAHPGHRRALRDALQNHIESYIARGLGHHQIAVNVE